MIVFQNPTAVMKADAAVFAVTTEDMAGMGFAIGDGKFLMTCDHVVGSDSKITIQSSSGPARHGYLVFHDAKLDVAVYRMDRASSATLTINSDTVPVGKTAFVIGKSPDENESSILHVRLSNIQREGERADISLSGSVDLKYSGSPVLNEKGEVIGMTQASASSGQTLSSALSGYNLAKFLKDQSGPAQPPHYLGKLGQVLQSTRVNESPDPSSRSYFVAATNQYLLVDDYSADYLKVILANGTEGYILSSMVRIVNSGLISGTPGVANGYEIIRVVNTFDASGIKASKTDSEWMAASAKFVNQVFTTAGREISDDPNVQLDIGRGVESIDDLQAGDRLYFGTPKMLRAAIYLGNDEYISVSKEGKLVRGKFDGTARKPFYRALH